MKIGDEIMVRGFVDEIRQDTVIIRNAGGYFGTAPSEVMPAVVRCKECKHNYNKTLNHGKMYPRCDFTDWKLSENDYCSRGEREGE